jgi:hypothetical protein
MESRGQGRVLVEEGKRPARAEGKPRGWGMRQGHEDEEE